MIEIKIICPCGQKYKFDVESVNGRMPWAVNCPVCGRSGEEAAERAIQEKLPSVSTEAPKAVLASGQTGTSFKLAASPPSAGTLAAASVPLPVSGATGAPVAVEQPHRGRKLAWQKWAWVLVTIVLAWYGFGSKKPRKWRLLKRTAAAVASSKEAEVAGEGPNYEWTLPSDNGAMLLVRHTNSPTIGQACVEYYRTQQRRSLTLVNANGEADESGLLLIAPAFNNCVQMDGPIFWDESLAPILGGLVQYLSQKFQTVTILALMGDDAEAGMFAIYDSGQRKFFCQRQVLISGGDLKEVVRTEGDAWVTSKGFKPAKGFNAFTMEDANDLTRHLGLKLDNRPEGQQFLMLRDAVSRPTR